jgi:enoyl-CoA hydratase/carnithine racemase
MGDTDGVGFETIRLEHSEGIATITLDRPDRLNAFTPTMADELVAAFDRTDTDDDVRAVIVTGEGRGFCAGADLASGADTFRPSGSGSAGGPTPVGDGAEGRARRDTGGLVTLRIFESLKPVIAAVNGPAVGVGASMTLAMDARLAADGARIGFVFAGRGIVPDAAASWFLPRIVGIAQALEWCLTARVFTASEAHAGGLVRSVHPATEPGAGAEARPRPSDGRPPGRLPGHRRDRRHGRRGGGHRLVPREATARLEAAGQRRPAAGLPVVGGAGVLTARASGYAAGNSRGRSGCWI